MSPFLLLAQFALADVTYGKTFSADQVLSPYIYVFYAAFIVAFLFTPVMRTVATYYGIIDQPDQLRKMHSTPVAYLGGVAVFLGWITGLAVSQFVLLHHAALYPDERVIVKFSIVIGASVIVVLGLWDDIKKISPRMKITGQVVAAVFMLSEGVGTHCTGPLLSPVGVRLQMWTQGHAGPEAFFPEWFVVASSCVVVVALVVFCCNATNLMDGLDGLCGGVTGVIAAGFLFLAVHLAMTGGGLNANRDALRVVLGLALLGSVLGFVPYNFNPASIFMGDTGSMFLGFACATQIILLADERPKWFLAAIVMFALPILDTVLAFTRRYVNKRPLFSADRFHFHHQLLARGLTVRKTVVLSYGLAIGFVLLGGFIVFMRTRYAVAFYLVIFGSIIVAAFKMGMVHERPRVVKRQPLGSSSGVASIDVTPSTPTLEPGTVIEIRDDSAEGTSPTPATPVAGAWEEPA
ncbi:MAG: glycosyltransferase family 4 protein [Tepidisphaeraceae bacterium]